VQREPFRSAALANLRRYKTGEHEENIHSKSADCMKVKLLAYMAKNHDICGQSSQGLEVIDLALTHVPHFRFARSISKSVLLATSIAISIVAVHRQKPCGYRSTL
jgi:phage replication-related protein YjqB (UPF0714/DUF867 family)